MSNKEYKLVVLGTGGVGKSALTIRLVTDNFLEDYDPTIEDSYRKLSTIDGDQVVLDILDTAGQEEYTSMQDQWMREGNGFLLVYSTTSRSSFDDIATFKDKILRAKDVDNVPIVLVGNKCDLEGQRQVSASEGNGLAQKMGCKFMETSAKERINNEDCFYEVVRAIRRAERPARPAPAPSAEQNRGSRKSGKKEKKKGGSLCTIL